MNMTTATRHDGDKRVTTEWTIGKPLDEAIEAAVTCMKDLLSAPNRHLVSIALWFTGESPFLICRVQYDDSSEQQL